jgi:sugar O-acyltransferase (sialic acid O-acetyltransferase NeuD family)
MTPLLLVGAGGHARSCIDVIEQEGRFEIVGLTASEREVGGTVLGYPVVGTDADVASLVRIASSAIVVVGQIQTAGPRIRLFNALRQAGYACPVIVSPRAYVSSHAEVGEGTVVLHGATVNAGARVGRNCIVNSHCLIEHDAVVGDHCHVSTGAVLNGNVKVGEGTFIGSRSVVKEGVSLGAGCVVGMGLSVRHDQGPDARVKGNV